MPEKTLDATYDHAEVTGDTVTGTYDESNAVLNGLEGLGISYNDVVAVLETEGLDKFVASWKELLDHVKDVLEAAAKDA
jgi:transaldolase